MGLDVHIVREEDEPWGFRLIGGVDFGMPLTVVKVFPNSPAERAGLHHGDVVISANCVDAVDMTHDESRAVVASAKDILVLGVTRGLYDPVLDDTEPIYEPIDLEDFDQPSQPTEVTLPDILEKLNGLPDFLLTPKLSESRSLTASPFPNQTRPYRPFSTEPLAVPPLEDPIILNPDYHDVFDKLDIDEDFLPKTRFKLPVSEQYDPDGTKQKVTVKTEEKVTVDMREVMSKEEVKFMEEMKKEMDLEKIELTASSVVNDSIEKAVSVAEEIKKEVDVELHESMMSSSQCKSIMETKVSEQATESKSEEAIDFRTEIDENKRSELKKSKEAANEVTELVELIDKTTNEIVKQNDRKSEVNVAKEVASFESVDINHEAVDKRRLSSKQNITETIVTGSVKSKSAVYDKERDVTDNKAAKETKYVEKKVKDAKVQRDVKQKTTAQSSVKGETKTDSKKSTAKLLSEQRAYTIGLQTIPNIRGTIHSSHFDMLLKTFFIHLTDVMVALSRFILLEPELKTEEKDDVVSEQTVTETVSEEGGESSYTSYERISEATQLAQKEEKKVENEVVEKIQQCAKKEVVESQNYREVTDDRIQEHAEEFIDEVVEKRIISGAKMAQLTEKKSEELMQKMGAVVTEFQNKAGIEDTLTEDITLHERRSRSRSKAKETKPSEILLNKSEETTEIKTSASEMSSSISESKEMKKIESQHQSSKTEVKSSKTQDGKTTYIAIVEAHVYTNKDSILDEQLTEFSEISSVQSADETNIALETNEAMSTEQVALKSEQINREVAKASIEETKDLSTVSAVKKQASVQTFEKTAEKQEKVQESSVKQTEIEFDTKSVIRKEEVNAQKIIKPTTEIQEEKSVSYESLQTVVNESKAKDSIPTESIITKQAAKIEIIEAKDAVAVTQISEIAKKEVIADVTDKAIFESIVAKEETMASVVETKVSDKVEKDAFAALKIAKEEIKEVSQDLQTINETDITIHNQVEVEEENKSFVSKVEERNMAQSFESQEIKESSFSAKLVESKQAMKESSFTAEVKEEGTSVIGESHQKVEQESLFVAKSLASQQIQESSFIAKSVSEEDTKKLSLKTDIAQKKFDTQSSVQIDEYIDTPTPSTIPPTPLTDEYVFKLEIPLPKQLETPVPRDCSPPSEHEDEDPHIVKKKLVPHIDTTVEEGVIFDPPLPTPPGNKVTSPVYTKPGLRGGMERPPISKEEILEIERKSTLLTSAIDETIKSIEAYKEEVGIETRKENITDNHSEESPIVYNGYAKVVETKVFDPKDNVNEDFALSPETIKSDVIEVPQDTKQEKELTPKQIETKVEMSNSNEEVIKSEDMEKKDHLEGYRPIQFNPEEIQSVKRELRSIHFSNNIQESIECHQRQAYMTETGEIIGTHQGIVDGLEEAVVDSEVAKELGKPGMTEEKIAELISGESEMLREAHVMGLSRVISAHMHRPDDSSVDFKKIKPIVDSLKDSEVLKALNDELMKTKEEQKKEERKWTKFLQKPKRAVPTAKCGYYGYTEPEEEAKEPYKVKIVKQPKPKVAPDYKPEDFNTGLLPWEERALREPTPPPVEAEDPILIPEESPEILEAVDPLPESEVPDLEDSGIPLPPPEEKEATPPPAEEEDEVEELDIEAVIEETEKIVEENLVEEMDQGKLAEQLMMSVQNMVDPNASLDQQLAQMRAQLAALAQLPCVIQQSLEMVTRQLSHLSQMESKQTVEHQEEESLQIQEENEVTQTSETIEETNQEMEEKTAETAAEESLEVKQSVTAEELERMRKEEEEMLEEQRRLEKQKKELMEQARIEHESRQVKQRSTPRVGKPKPVFGPATPQERPVVLPGGRRWRNPKDAYNEQFIAETLAAQAEIIQGKAKGLSYESVRLPYDERINFMKYEKPPVSLDHLQHSDVYKLVHNMEQPIKRVDMLTPVIAECDYREKCLSVTPCNARMAMEEHIIIPQQVQP